MKIKIGDIINAMLGSNQVHKLYKGSTLIYNYKGMSNLFGYSLYYDTENDPYLSREMFPYFYDANYNSSSVLVKNQLDAYITLTTKYGTTETFTIDKNENTIPENISRYRLSEIKYIDANSEDKQWYKTIINNNYGTRHKIIEFPDFMKNNVIELEADLYGLKDYENLFKDFVKLENVKYLKYSHSKYNVDPRYSNYATISAKNMFSGCVNLKKLHLGSFKVFNIYTMESMFENCKSLEYINLDNFDVSNCDDFSQMFYASKLSCDLNLTSFEIKSSANTTNMLNFYNHGHKNVYVTDYFNKTEEECDYCCEFTNLILASIYTFNKISDDNYIPDSVKNNIYTTRDNILDNNIIERKLYLLDEDINNLSFEVKNATVEYISPVISIDYIKIKSDRISLENMFKNCNSLEYINIDNIDLSNITNYNSCFYNCSSLESLNLTKISMPENYNTEYMFFNVNSNCKICINQFIFLKTELDCYFDGEFYRIDKLAADYNFYTRTHFANHEPYNYNEALCDYFYKYNPIETDDNIFIIIDNEIDNGEKINRKIYISKNSKILSVQFGVFSDNSGGYTKENYYSSIYNKLLTEVNYIEITKDTKSLSNLFNNCGRLKNFYGENWDTSNVTDMSYMFYGCDELQSLDLSNFNTDNVNNMSCMFSGCVELQSLDLSNFNTDNVNNMSGMFSGCVELQSLDLSSFNTEKVTDMSSMFGLCQELQSLDLSNFNTYNVNNMRYMFSYCSSLELLDLSSFNTEKVTDMTYMFQYSCGFLESLDLSSFTVKSISDTNTKTYSMFQGFGCNNIIIDNSKFLRTEKECDYYSGTFERI